MNAKEKGGSAYLCAKVTNARNVPTLILTLTLTPTSTPTLTLTLTPPTLTPTLTLTLTLTLTKARMSVRATSLGVTSFDFNSTADFVS